MSESNPKVPQYLAEARSAELALVRVLQAQIAATPKGAYRSLLETHLRETRGHADRVQRRLSELGHGQSGGPWRLIGRVAQAVGGQVLTVVTAPISLFRGSGDAETVLKDAQAAYASEALEIATYTALESVARKSGDLRTAELAAEIRSEEERMRERVLAEFPQLTDAVFRAEGADEKPSRAPKTGAAETVRKPSRSATTAAGKTGERAKRAARKTPAPARVEGTVKDATGTLPVAQPELSQSS